MTVEALIRRETLLSTAINAVLSGAFFIGVFGLDVRLLSLAAPDYLARDFLPQGAVIALMATLVPALAVRRALRREGHPSRPAGRMFSLAAMAVAAALLVSATLMASSLLGPLDRVNWVPALVTKVAFGGLLGAVVTDRTLRRLYPTKDAT